MRLHLVMFLFSAYLGPAAAYGQAKSTHHVDTSMYVVFRFDKSYDFAFMQFSTISSQQPFLRLKWTILSCS